MKRLSVLAATLATLLAGSAHAQSSVTLFGVVDLAARSVTNNTAQKRLEAGGSTASRLGVRGTEDLGGGLKAGFWLEGALTPDDGNAAGFNWQRRSTVSLMGGFGELRLGRAKNPTGLNWEQFDVFGATGMGSSDRLQQSVGLIPSDGVYGSFPRSSNSISYLTPGSSGLFGEATVAAGEGSLGGKYTGGRVGYRGGDLVAAAAYGTTQVTGAIDAKMANAGIAYDLKVVRLVGFYSTTHVGPARQDNALVAASVPVGAFSMRASYQLVKGKGSISNQEAKMLALGASYDLSRRTAVYTTLSDIKNTNTSFTVATGSPLTRGNYSKGYELGLRHAF
jgi:predicted porin